MSIHPFMKPKWMRQRSFRVTFNVMEGYFLRHVRVEKNERKDIDNGTWRPTMVVFTQMTLAGQIKLIEGQPNVLLENHSPSSLDHRLIAIYDHILLQAKLAIQYTHLHSYNFLYLYYLIITEPTLFFRPIYSDLHVIDIFRIDASASAVINPKYQAKFGSPGTIFITSYYPIPQSYCLLQIQH